jgi:cytochrome c peroxidase
MRLRYASLRLPAGKEHVQARTASGAGDCSPSPQWKQLAPQFNGMFQTATVRNVDKRPRPDFVKEDMHNGYLKSLKEVVHFYNTSQALPQCAKGSPREKGTCWPAPEYPATVNTTQLGNLGSSSDEEDDIVAFLQTLTDGFCYHTSPASKKKIVLNRQRQAGRINFHGSPSLLERLAKTEFSATEE